MLRIESLQPHMANGLILLHSSQATLISQLRHFPKADHDDGPDALEMLWRNAVSSSAAIEWISISELDDSDWMKMNRIFILCGNNKVNLWDC